MSTPTLTPTTTSALHDSGRRLTPVHQVALAVAVVGVVAVLFATTSMSGKGQFVALVVPAYAVAQTALSFATEGRRHAADRFLTLIVHLALLAAVIPLGAVLSYTVYKGVGHLDLNFLTHSMKGIGPLDDGGGVYHAIVGTVEQVLLAIVLAVPLGLLVAVYITEYGRGWLASAVRFVVDIMTGIPSIVAGLFIFAFLVIGLKQGYSGFAASLALAILMLPVVVRSSEEMIKLVPDELREASYALGIPKWVTVLRVVLPTASAGITTGVMIAIARVTGETAPLLLTSFIAEGINTNPFEGKQAAIPTYIFSQIGQGRDINYDRAWAAALTLITIVLTLYVSARLLTRRNTLRR